MLRMLRLLRLTRMVHWGIQNGHGLHQTEHCNLPQKRVNTQYEDLFPKCSVKYPVLNLRLLVLPKGPGGFRELREAGRNHFHLSWYL